MGFLVDQSSSMAKTVSGGNKSKSEETADALNNILGSLITKNTSGEEIFDRFHIFILGYGAHGIVSPVDGITVKEMPVPLSKLAKSGKTETRLKKAIKKEPDGAGGVIEREYEKEIKFKVWVKPEADGGTPMGEAFRKSHELIQNWTSSHQKSFPPILINITDGEFTDEDPMLLVQDIKNLGTDYGNALVFNIHISEDSGQQGGIAFPDDSFQPPNDYAATLFAMSSHLTPDMIEYAKSKDRPVFPNARGFAFNANLIDLIEFLDIGTRLD